MPNGKIPPPPSGNITKVDSLGDRPMTQLDGIPAPPSGKAVNVNLNKIEVAMQQQQSIDNLSKKKFSYDPTSSMNRDEQEWLFENRDTKTPEELEEARLVFSGDHEDQNFMERKYYFDPNTGNPKPLQFGEKIPENAQIASVWGFKPGDDGPLSTLAKSTFNGLITIAAVPTNLLDIASGIITDDETWANQLGEHQRNVGEAIKFTLSDKANEPIVNEKAFESVAEFFNSENWDPSLDNLMALTGNISGSMAQFMSGAGWLKGVNTAAKVSGAVNNASKVNQLMKMIGISSAISTNEALNSVKDVEDLSMREKMAFALMNSTVIGTLEVAMGGPEMRLLTGMRRSGVNETVSRTLLNEIKKDAGNITGKSLERAYKVALDRGSSAINRVGPRLIRDSFKEASEEFTQTLWQKSSEQMVDVLKGFQEGEGFGTTISSPETLQELFISSLSGAIGGSLGGVVLPSNNKAQNSVIYDHVKSNRTLELRNSIENLFEEGKLSEEERDNTMSRIDVYKSYFDNTQDIDVNDADRKELFHSIWELEQLGKEVDQVEKDEAISDELKVVKTQNLDDRRKQLKKKIDNLRKGVKERPDVDLTDKEKETVAEFTSIPEEPQAAPQTAREFDLNLRLGQQVIVAGPEGNLMPDVSPMGIVSEINDLQETVKLEGIEEDIPISQVFPNTKSNLRAIVNPGTVPSKGLTQEELEAQDKLSESERDFLLDRGFTVQELEGMPRKRGQQIIRETQQKFPIAEQMQLPEEEIERITTVSKELAEAGVEVDPERMLQEVAERSTDPEEMAISFIQAEELGEAKGLGFKENVIAESGFRVTKESFRRFGDPNLIKGMKQVPLNYFTRDITLGSADVIADELSRDSGIEITPQDLVDFIVEHPGGHRSALKKQREAKSELARDIATRFREVTGKRLTPEVARGIVEKEVEVEPKAVDIGEPVEEAVDTKTTVINKVNAAIKAVNAGNNINDIKINGKKVGEYLLENKDKLSEEEYKDLLDKVVAPVAKRDLVDWEDADEFITQMNEGKKIDLPEDIADNLEIPDEDLPFQKELRDETTSRISTFRDIDILTRKINKSFPNINAYVSKNAFDITLDAVGYKGTEEDKPLGFVYRGSVYINPEKATLETPIHEFGHVWTLFTKENNPDLYNQGIDLVKDTEYMDFVQKRYPELTEEQMLEEALSTAIGEKGANAFLNRESQLTFLDRFKNFFDDLFQSIRKFFGFPTETEQNFEDNELTQFVNSVAEDLLAEDPISLMTSSELSLLQGIELTQQKAVSQKELDEIGRLTLTAKEKVAETASQVFTKVKKALNETVVPISTRLTRKSPNIARLLKKFEFNVSKFNGKYSEVINDYLKARVNAGMTEEERAKVDYLLMKQEHEQAKEILKTFGIEKEIDKVINTLNEIKDRSIDSGIDLEVLDDYFPRVVKDFNGLVEHMLTNQGKFSPILDAIEAKEEEYLANEGRPMTNEEKASLADTLFRGYTKSGISLAKIGNEKARTVDLTPELFRFYYRAEEALPIYTGRMNNVIEARKLFRPKNTELGKADVESSLGAMMIDEITEGNITDIEAKEIQKILLSRFNQGTPGKLIQDFKNVAYIAVMGNPGSAVTQIGDLAFSIYKNGLMTTLKNVRKAAISESLISKKDLGIENISSEFMSRRKTSFWVNRVFRIVGLEFMDRIGKETFINSTIDRLSEQAQDPTPEFLNELSLTLEENEMDQAIQDLKDKSPTELVKRIAFNELSGVQPISPSEMPESYLRGGNSKIFYMLKSFTIKQVDFYRREIFDGLSEGIKTGDKVLIAQKMKDLMYFSAVFALMGMTSDEIKDLIFGKEVKFSDNVMNNVIKLSGFNKYTIYNAKRKGIMSAGIDFIMPPYNVLDDLSKDAFTLGDNKGFKSTKYVPLAGKSYYYWFGRGAE